MKYKIYRVSIVKNGSDILMGTYVTREAAEQKARDLSENGFVAYTEEAEVSV